MIALLAVWFWLHRDDCSDRALVLAAALLAVAIPFFLPHMHDRYFFAADALTLALATAWPHSGGCSGAGTAAEIAADGKIKKST